MLQRLGADAVGMSTVPEALAAVQAGLRVAALSLITNSHYRRSSPPSHEEVLRMARQSGERLKRLLAAAIHLSA
jgi:purine-nucleoside phosphorylase